MTATIFVAFTTTFVRSSNTIVRKLNQYAVGVVAAAVSANSRTITGHSWSSAIPNGATPTAPASTPFGDLNLAKKNAETDEMGIEYDTLLLNPNEELSLLNFTQFDAGKLREALAAIGITETSRRTVSRPDHHCSLHAGQVGEFRVEEPLATVSWREEGKEKTWWKSSVRPVAYVTNAFAIVQINGVA